MELCKSQRYNVILLKSSDRIAKRDSAPTKQIKRALSPGERKAGKTDLFSHLEKSMKLWRK